MVQHLRSNFRVITAKFSGVRKPKTYTVVFSVFLHGENPNFLTVRIEQTVNIQMRQVI